MTPPPRPNLKAQVLADLDSDRAVVLESTYIPLIWESEERLADWCDSWNLQYKIAAGSVPRERHGMKLPIYWLEITRPNHREELSTLEEPDFLEETQLERSDITDETDASL
jgi:hypothetical protein